MSYSKIQELALKITRIDNTALSLKHKNELLSYLSEYSDSIDSLENSFLVTLFELYLNNLLLLNKDTTTLLIATHFNLNINKSLSNPSLRKVVFDISPKYKHNDWFSQSYIIQIGELLAEIKKSKLEYKIRVCDGVSSLGEVQWFDPYLNGKNMSVKWDYNTFSVRDFETTCRMCEMAKRSWRDYIYA